MNWTQKIKQILGSFWLNIWQDNWLVDLLCTVFTVFVGTNLHRQLEAVQKQTACSSLLQPDTTQYVKILLDSTLLQGKNTISIAELSMGASLAPQNNGKKAYKALKTLDVPQKLLVNIYEPESALLRGTDFIYNKDSQCLQFSDSLPSYGFVQTPAIVNDQIKTCYVLWAEYNINTALRDNFTGILQLPLEWLYKYPGAIEAAWSIKQNGANKEDVFALLKAVGGQGQRLLRYPAIYTWRDQLPGILGGLHIPTEVGILFADDQIVAVSDSILPLKDLSTGSISSGYRSLCQARNLDSSVPYVKLPAQLNPAKFILQKVWGPAACVIIAPDDSQDMQRAVQFIIDNTIMGTIILVYTAQGRLLYPSRQKQDQLMLYYKNFANNGTTYKEHKKDLQE